MPDGAASDLLLTGCQVTPLAGYLKGLAVLRLVSKQADPAAQAAWRGDVLLLRSRLDRGAVLDFFLDRYRPTPVVAPWNGGSGFGQGDNQAGIGVIEQSGDPRFAGYRRVIEQVRAWPEMPRSYRVVAELVTDLEAAVRDARPGKARQKRQALLDDERGARQKAAGVLGERAALAAELAWLERVSKDKKLEGTDKRAVSAWWKAVKKLRTDCGSLCRRQNKEQILELARARLPEACLPWLDAAYAVRADDTASYHPVLGTGGNEGRLDLSNNFMQRVAELLGADRDRHAAERLLASALLGEPVAGLPKSKIGQFDPGARWRLQPGRRVRDQGLQVEPLGLRARHRGGALSGIFSAQAHG